MSLRASASERGFETALIRIETMCCMKGRCVNKGASRDAARGELRLRLGKVGSQFIKHEAAVCDLPRFGGRHDGALL